MQRSIKFRAWDIDKKKMIYFTEDDGFQIIYECGGISVCELDNQCDVDRILHPVNYIRDGYVDECILMQFTGLKDKNGKEIFEGDVVKLTESDYRLVEWWKGAFWLKGIGHPKRNFPMHFWAYRESPECEIIGDIHSNPSLLEDGK